MRSRSRSMRALLPVLATGVIHLTSFAAESDDCEAVAGVFLAAGQLREGDWQPRPVVYLERTGDASDGRHHFQYRFNSKRGVGEVAMFNAKGELLFDTTVSAHTCKAGVLMREGVITGGSEGCSREGVSRSTLSISSSGSLTFATEENIKYGFWCFKSPASIRRTAEFLPYPAQVK
jgi:hypothetical protein